MICLGTSVLLGSQAFSEQAVYNSVIFIQPVCSLQEVFHSWVCVFLPSKLFLEHVGTYNVPWQMCSKDFQTTMCTCILGSNLETCLFFGLLPGVDYGANLVALWLIIGSFQAADNSQCNHTKLYHIILPLSICEYHIFILGKANC